MENTESPFFALFCRLNSSANDRPVGWSLFRPDSTNELEIAVSYTRQPITERHVLFMLHVAYSTVNTAPGIEKVEVECMTSTFSNPALFHSVFPPHIQTDWFNRLCYRNQTFSAG